MSDIFISYRRGTASPYARGIYERLVKQFGASRVFMDIDTMEPGVDFVEYIENAVGSCRVLIVVIGPDWVATVDDTGGRRLDDPDDFVRVEVTAALARAEVRVIPVLVADAPPPRKAELPEDLVPLTRRQALEVTDGRWEYDHRGGRGSARLGHGRRGRQRVDPNRQSVPHGGWLDGRTGRSGAP